jgi:hypothetical protein
MAGWLMNNELEKTRKEAVVASFKVLFLEFVWRD